MVAEDLVTAEEGAKKAVGQGVYEARVKMITETFDMTEAFIEMMDARAT